MRPGFGGKGARRQQSATGTLYFARDLLPKPHAHGPIAAPDLELGLLLAKFAGQTTRATTCS